ncbi:hypothetical protein RFI_14696 [Reticulomyxa filosa]|uniref:dihydrolipoyl dehydrogenase n=1 Tax=Reticulomyxa filosa TaxID=46433 RepID=X6NB13_RETFI|nr:hypothetical protein RFI_14696 [Reticulomyxa filosa]|eukprot:ETO22502.1 hypothetical protein RFI_14696 [Reticulomyxa filosa]
MCRVMDQVDYAKGWGKITGNNEVTVKLLDGKEQKITAKNIVIATGSESSKLPGIEFDEKDIVSSTGALSFTQAPKRLVVVGAGVIGLELGSVWQRLGSDVTVVEYLDRILPGIDNEVATKFQRMLQKQGFKFQLGTGVQSIKKGADGYNIVVKDAKKGTEQTVVADKVLVAIGRRPYTHNLGLQELKIAMDGPRVAVNNHWQSTSHSSIYAIGDVIRGPMLAHKAEEEGIAVAESLAGGHGHVNLDAIPGVIYTYPEVAVVGKTEEQLKEANIEFKKSDFPFLANSRARTNQETEGFVKILTDAKTNKLLGAHIIGPNAGEMIAEAVIGIEYGASGEDLGRTCHAHPVCFIYFFVKFFFFSW